MKNGHTIRPQGQRGDTWWWPYTHSVCTQITPWPFCVFKICGQYSRRPIFAAGLWHAAAIYCLTYSIPIFLFHGHLTLFFIIVIVMSVTSSDFSLRLTFFFPNLRSVAISVICFVFSTKSEVKNPIIYQSPLNKLVHAQTRRLEQ